jgi:hypothetical protein
MLPSAPPLIDLPAECRATSLALDYVLSTYPRDPTTTEFRGTLGNALALRELPR